MPFGRVGIGCDSLSSAALQIKSQEPSLRGKVYQPPVSPGGGTSSSLILSRSVLHSADAPFRTHLPRARCTARLFLPLSLQSQTRQRKLLCPDSLFGAAVSSFVDADTVRIPVVPPCSVQSLLCSAVFRGVIGAFQQTAPASLTASSLRCLIRSRLLRHHFGTHLAPAAGLSRPKRCGRVPLFHHRASGGVNFLPRSNLIPSAACRAVPACLLTSYETLSASLPETRKMSSPPILTHASAYCQERPASPARTGQKKIYQ